MSSISIKTVRSKNDLMQFIKFQWEIYKGDSNWVPPLIIDRKKILNKEKNPFFKHSEAEYFLAERDGKLVGRIAAIKNDLHNKHHNDKVGFFGFFECINDQEVADALFNKAKEWLQSKGLNKMRGPANPSSNDEYAMLLEGFDSPALLLMTYNPSYYLELCNNYGLKKAKDLYAYKLENKKTTSSEKVKRVAEIASKRYGLKISQLNMKEFDKEVEKVKFVYNKSWEPNWGFVPMTDEELDAMAKDLKPIVEPSLVLFGEINGNLVGFALVMPDYNEIFKTMNGKLLPFGFIKLLTQKKKIKKCRIIALGIIPEYQKKGLDAAFYWEIVNRAHNVGIDWGEASWVLEDNDMMNRGLETLNGDIYKKYRIYEIDI
jgi:GNAT superfamily N-acetyltransferase